MNVPVCASRVPTGALPRYIPGSSGGAVLPGDPLAPFLAELVEDKEISWSFSFHLKSGQPDFRPAADSPTLPMLRALRATADGPLVLGSLSWDIPGDCLVVEVDSGPAATRAALESYLSAAGRRYRLLRDDEEEEEEAPHPYPILQRFLAALQLASEPWSFLYVPSGLGKSPVLELRPEDPDPLVALSYLLDGREVYSGFAAFDGNNQLSLEVHEGGDPTGLLQADYAPFFAAFDSLKVAMKAPPPAPAAAPTPEAPRLPSPADVVRLRGMLKARSAQIQKGETGRFVYFGLAADGQPLLVLSKPGAEVESSMRRAGATVAAEGAWRCLVPGGIEFSESPAFDPAMVAAELGFRFRFAKV